MHIVCIHGHIEAFNYLLKKEVGFSQVLKIYLLQCRSRFNWSRGKKTDCFYCLLEQVL